MGNKRDRAEVIRVVKEGDGYRVSGTYNGHREEFFVHSSSIDHMNPDAAKSFMRRSIANVVKHKEGGG